MHTYNINDRKYEERHKKGVAIVVLGIINTYYEKVIIDELDRYIFIKFM